MSGTSAHSRSYDTAVFHAAPLISNARPIKTSAARYGKHDAGALVNENRGHLTPPEVERSAHGPAGRTSVVRARKVGLQVTRAVRFEIYSHPHRRVAREPQPRRIVYDITRCVLFREREPSPSAKQNVTRRRGSPFEIRKFTYARAPALGNAILLSCLRLSPQRHRPKLDSSTTILCGGRRGFRHSAKTTCPSWLNTRENKQ